MTGISAGNSVRAVVALAMLGCAVPAAAQSLCGERAAIVAELESYGETRRSIGLQHGTGIVELWASERTGSWTILVTNTRGETCMMAAGEAFATEGVTRTETPA